MIRFLLLSDIHLLSLAKEQDIHYNVRCSFLKDLADYVKENGAITHILVSGDIANKGEESEYQCAKSFFQQVCNVAGCSLKDVYVIPGNHDKNFNADRSELRHIINAGLSINEDNIKFSTSNLFYKLLNDTDAIRMMYAPFKAYLNFALEMDSYESIMQRVLDDSQFKYNPNIDTAYYRKQLGTLSGYEINLYGINSCLTSDWYDEDDDGNGHKLFLPQLSYNIPTESDGCINISMMHHPLEKIALGTKISNLFDKKFHVQIYGHLHKPVSSIASSVRIQSGAFQPPKSGSQNEDGYFSVYNIVELDVKNEESKDVLVVKLLVEKFDDLSEKFEHMADESSSFRIPLKKHTNRWTSSQTKEPKSEQLPKGISIRQIRLVFLQSDSREYIMKQFGEYNENKSLNQNCIDFLRKMEEECKLHVLWNKLKTN